MSWHLWLVFSLVVLGATLAPGPSVLLALTHGVRYGSGRAFYTVTGIMVAAAIYASVALAGLGATLAASADLFIIVKWCGAAYLIWVGVGLLRSKTMDFIEVEMSPALAAGWWKLFRQGLLVGLSNPKAIIFFTSLFPQFIPADAAGSGYMAAMIAGVVLWGYVGTMAYALGGHSLTRVLRRPLVNRYFQKGVGAAFICSGVGLAAAAEQ